MHSWLQRIAFLTGSYEDEGGWKGNIGGTVSTSTRKLEFQITYSNPAGRTETWKGNADSTFTTASGTWNCPTDGNQGSWTAGRD